MLKKWDRRNGFACESAHIEPLDPEFADLPILRERKEVQLDSLPKIPVKIMMNVGNPDRAFDFAAIPNHGVGLARLEFIINRMIGVHPRALLEFDRLDADLKEQIRAQMAGYADPVGFYVEKLSEGIAQIAAAFAPEPVPDGKGTATACPVGSTATARAPPTTEPNSPARRPCVPKLVSSVPSAR